MESDIVISQKAKLQNIYDIASKVGINKENVEPYGNFKAKITPQDKVKGKLILVTAINPTASGEGKTTVSIGLADALNNLNKNCVLALREPSLGPVFGIKGGATGGGYSQVIPMEDINLHFTGDMHAITSANNLLSSLIDNHIYHGNELNLDTNNIFFHRCIDLNDRALRYTKVAGKNQGVERDEGFTITAASEVMASLCLATDLDNLKERLANICVGLNKDGEYVFAKDLNAQGAMAVLLKDAIKPNLVQTLYKTPCFMHGGPFANIAHGCNSIIATKTALSYGDYVVTEAGFGADLGAEKFLDVKCRVANIEPNCVVIVATCRALKLHGGVLKTNLNEENIPAIKEGITNLIKHIENIKNVYKKPCVVAINRFPTDTDNEISFVKEEVEKFGAEAIVSTAFSDGDKGAICLAKKVVELCDIPSKLNFSYDLDMSIKEKINCIVTKIYGGLGATFSKEAEEKIAKIEKSGFKNLPVVIAKTQYSLSDDATLLARPKDFTINIRDIELRSGAGFVVALAGKIMLMPGLPKTPASNNVDVVSGIVSGLF